MKACSTPKCITQQEWPRDTKPVVSICCMTFNHESYIRDCLDGIFHQETTFPIEVLLYDDASVDNTVEIIRDYECRYPSVIRPIYQTENQYKKKIKINATFNFPRVTGKYIAICDGDDFWHDVRKLQTQVAYMETHPELSACFHNVHELHDGAINPGLMFTSPMPLTFSLQDIACKNRVPMVSVLFRARLFPAFPEWYHHMPIGDWPLHVLNAEHGDIGYLDKVLATYRVHGGGVWSRLSEIEAFQTNITVSMAIDKHLGHRFSDAIGKNVAYWNYRIAKSMLQAGARKGVLSHLLKALRYEHEEIPRQDVYRSIFKIIAPSVYWRWERILSKSNRR